MDAQAIADAVRERMFAQDRASQALGMAVTRIGPHHATVTMTVREDMLNGFAICHGGLITTLADTAFAFACNAGNRLTVANGISVDIVAPARLGELLQAEARALHRGGRTGVYEVTVRKASGETVAFFRGKAYELQGQRVLPDLPTC